MKVRFYSCQSPLNIRDTWRIAKLLSKLESKLTGNSIAEVVRDWIDARHHKIQKLNAERARLDPPIS